VPRKKIACLAVSSTGSWFVQCKRLLAEGSAGTGCETGQLRNISHATAYTSDHAAKPRTKKL